MKGNKVEWSVAERKLGLCIVRNGGKWDFKRPSHFPERKQFIMCYVPTPLYEVVGYYNRLP